VEDDVDYAEDNEETSDKEEQTKGNDEEEQEEEEEEHESEAEENEDKDDIAALLREERSGETEMSRKENLGKRKVELIASEGPAKKKKKKKPKAEKCKVIQFNIFRIPS
jgi:cobalamin biosynthesis protein CobT